MEAPLPDGVDIHTGDLEDPRSLTGVADGCDVLIHCASYIGGSAERAERTNVMGTRAVLTEARRAGVRRVVYLSTAGVYGRGPFRNRGHESLAVAPSSMLSGTRAQAEQLVLDAGGTVLRPHLVFGTGDIWVGPRAVRLATLLQGRVDGFDAAVSMVDARRLAEVTVRVALSPPPDVVSQIYDCNHPVPVVAADCLRVFMGLAGVSGSSDGPMSRDEAHEALRMLGESTHDLDMLAVDSWFDSASVWTDLQLNPGPPFVTAVADHRAWYSRTPEGLIL